MFPPLYLTHCLNQMLVLEGNASLLPSLRKPEATATNIRVKTLKKKNRYNENKSLLFNYH